MQQTFELASENSDIDLPTVNIGLNLAVPRTKSGAIDLTKALLIGEGGTHKLYRFPNAPVVIKLMKENPNPEKLAELEKKYAVLYNCFDKDGKQRCIREKHITFPVQLPGKDTEESAALSIVPYEKCFKSQIKFDFKIEPAELDPYLIKHNKELFTTVNKVLLHQANSPGSFNLNDYSAIDERIGMILQRLDNDLELRKVMIEFLTHYRDFYRKTNIILDAVGFENILFFKDDNDKWQFKIGSAIKHDTGQYTNELFAKLASEQKIDWTQFINFTHAYYSPANIRAVNICAMKLGLEPIINDVEIATKDLFEITQLLSVLEHMLSYARHGDFTSVEKMLNENKAKLNFNLRDFWAYSLIADEYIKQAQPLSALKQYLDIVSQLPIVLPDNENDAVRIKNAKDRIIERKNTVNKEIKSMQDKKMQLHEELKVALPKFSIWSSLKKENALPIETAVKQFNS
ncbi:hypothetical protein ACNVED_09240 [Legionella sp. D16C41]|uniref:hypothetical protein n=1 Tax=Legionella sp. D16C41 TaxID=3402688 RepID=UPI003AF773DC